MERKVIIGSIRAAALSGALFLAGGAVPFIGWAAMLLCPAPVLLFASARPGANSRALTSVLIAAVLVVALSAIPFGLVSGALLAGNYLATFGISAVIMTWMIERRRPFEMIVVITGTAIFLSIAFAALVVYGSPAAIAKAMQTGTAALLSSGQEKLHFLGFQNVLEPQAQSEALDAMVRLSPALLAILACLIALANLRAFWRWAGKERLSYPLFGDLARWSAPEWLIWGLIASGFGMLAPIPPIAAIAQNVCLCFATVYFFQGLAIMGFYFQALSMPSPVRAIIYFVTIVQPVVSLVVCLAGIFDMWIDFRRLKPPSQEAGNYGDFL